jgi:hypothetical protein
VCIGGAGADKGSLASSEGPDAQENVRGEVPKVGFGRVSLQATDDVRCKEDLPNGIAAVHIDSNAAAQQSLGGHAGEKITWTVASGQPALSALPDDEKNVTQRMCL